MRKHTFAYDVSAYLANILSLLTGKSGYTVTNSAHFVSTVSNKMILDNEIMVSFDVESRFTNVPIDAAVQAALQKLEDDPSLADRTTLTPVQIADLLTFILRSTYFQYNGSISRTGKPNNSAKPASEFKAIAVKERDRDIRLAHTETSAVSEHAHNTGHKPRWNEVRFIDRDPYYYTRRVKEAIHTRLHPHNINRDS